MAVSIALLTNLWINCCQLAMWLAEDDENGQRSWFILVIFSTSFFNSVLFVLPCNLWICSILYANCIIEFWHFSMISFTFWISFPWNNHSWWYFYKIRSTSQSFLILGIVVFWRYASMPYYLLSISYYCSRISRYSYYSWVSGLANKDFRYGMLIDEISSERKCKISKNSLLLLIVVKFWIIFRERSRRDSLERTEKRCRLWVIFGFKLSLESRKSRWFCTGSSTSHF